MNEIFFRPITSRDRWVCIICILHSNDYGHPLLGTNSDRSSRLVHCPTVPETKAIARAHTSSAMMEEETSSDGESSTSVSSVVPTYAFAFDIDGALLAGGEVIPGAREPCEC